MINAKPSINGNSRDHFIDAYADIQAARDALMKAIGTTRQNVMHGRNYLHMSTMNGDHEAGRSSDDDYLEKLREAVGTLDLLAMDIVEAVK